MDTEYWYRCNQCGYMYTPQQVQALVQLQASRSGEADVSEKPPAAPGTISCRKKGCDGVVLRTESVFREGR
jgi:hypothetical protein